MPRHDSAGPRPASVSLPVIQQGPQVWRSLEELAGTPEFEAYLHREFPENAPEWCGGSRREFLKWMGASLALAGLTGCEFRPPREPIVPLVQVPEQMIPGVPLDFCTAEELGGWATGLIARSRMGRPVKLEGNPRHPASRGGTGVFAQAATLGLYDPDRARTIVRGTTIAPLSDLRQHLAALRVALDATAGAGLRILSTRTSSPTLGRLADALRIRWPSARWHVYDAVSPASETAGNRLAWGDAAVPVVTAYQFARAAVVLSIGADFLAARETPVAWVKDFADARRVAGRPPQPSESGRPVRLDRAEEPMLRLYSLAATPTLTDAKADHHLAVTPQQMVSAVVWLAARLQAVPGLTQQSATASWTSAERDWLETCADDLQRHRPENAAEDDARVPLVVAGREQPPVVHALVHAINAALGAAGRSVRYLEGGSAVGGDDPAEASVGSLAELSEAIRNDRVQNVIVLGGNPAFDAPADLRFAEMLRRVPERLHLSTARNETSALCQWHVPQSHFLESWGDTRAFDGTASIIQPLIAPLFDSLTSIELIGLLLAAPEEPLEATVDRPERAPLDEQAEDLPRRPDRAEGYSLVRQTWRQWHEHRSQAGTAAADGLPPFEEAWRSWLEAGVIEGTSRGERTPEIQEDFAARIEAVLGSSAGTPSAERLQSSRKSAAEHRFSVLFRPDPNLWDGRFANNGWLQELPKPITKLTWDNAAWIAVEDAARLELQSGDLVELRDAERKIVTPVWIVPRQSAGTLTLFFGYGRRQIGRLGAETGFDVYPLRTSRTMWLAENVRLMKTGKRYPLAGTQHHSLIDSPDRVRVETRDKMTTKTSRRAVADREPVEGEASFYPPWSTNRPRWGMTIDLTACTGCTACVIACQAENNIPVVGKEQVAMNREMHWIRVDMYHSGGAADPERIYHQPVPCMHCELAPCEVVCPVAATMHSDHGLNQMIYNRCVGTRYCSNNCPYKVRRFNFFNYGPDFIDTPSLRLLSNPEVTVRSRGVMEKCTYCVQRIQAAEIAATLEDRPLRDGDVQTACQQVCPAGAIEFGDLSDPVSGVHQQRQHPLNYALLEELNTRPRTTYLAEVKNPVDQRRAAQAPEADGAAERPAVP